MSRGQIQSGTKQNPFTAKHICGATPQIRDAAEQICDATDQIWDATEQICDAMDQIWDATTKISCVTDQMSFASSQICGAGSNLCCLKSNSFQGVSGILCKEQFRVFASYIISFLSGGALSAPPDPRC